MTHACQYLFILLIFMVILNTQTEATGESRDYNYTHYNHNIVPNSTTSDFSIMIINGSFMIY